MKGFLRVQLDWLRDTLRWYWPEVILVTAAVWIAMALALVLLST